jgi:hypothetical protein
MNTLSSKLLHNSSGRISLGFAFTKRQKIIASSVVFMLGFLAATQRGNIVFGHYYLILAMGLLAYLLSLWSLWEEMTKLKAVVLMILPVFFSLGATGFYFTFREIQAITQIPMALILGFMFYALLLSQNVFNVAASRTIPLYRAASTSSFVFTLVTAFFLFGILFTLNLPFYWNFLITFLIALPLVLQSLWCVEMEEVSLTIIAYSIVLALLTAECALGLSFWPVQPTIWSLFLATSLYLSLGVMTESMRERLSRRVVWEYIGVGVVVITFAFLATSWVG